jgi:anti-anti-sigma regulatory factor
VYEILEAPPEVTIASAKTFAAAIVATLADHDEVRLDLRRLEAVDLSFLQLICAARVRAAESGKILQLQQSAPEPIRKLLERAGFLEEASASDLAFWLHEASPQ